MLTLILIDVQYLINVVFSFEKDLNSQNSLLLRFPPPYKNPPSKMFNSPTPSCYLENPGGKHHVVGKCGNFNL